MKMVDVNIKFNREEFGKIIKSRREEFGVTQAELAVQIGMSDAFVSGVERGVDNYLTVSTMTLLINALDIEIWRYNLWVAE